MKDPALKEILRELYEIYSKNNEYGSLYEPLKEDTAQAVNALVAYVKMNY